MSIFTKLFVVLAMILSVVLVSLIVPFVARTEDYRQKLSEADAARAAASAAANARQQEINSLLSAESKTITELRAAQVMLDSRIAELTEKLAQSEVSVQRERVRADQLAADVSRLSSGSEQSGEVLQRQSAELEAARDNLLKMQAQLIQVADRTNELTSERDTLMRRVRMLQETNADLNTQLNDVRTRIAQATREVQGAFYSPATTSGGPFEPEFAISGEVTGVQQFGGDTFIKINVGSNDNVQENMKFLIHQNGQYVGTLVISAVDMQESAGRVTQSTGTISAGAQVFTGKQ